MLFTPNSHFNPIVLQYNIFRKQKVLNKDKTCFIFCVICFLTSTCEKRLFLANSGHRGFVFSDQSSPFFNAAQMTGSNRIMKRLGGRRGGTGG